MTDEFDVDLDAGREREDRRARSRERRARRGKETPPESPAASPVAARPSWDGPTTMAPAAGAPATAPPGPAGPPPVPVVPPIPAVPVVPPAAAPMVPPSHVVPVVPPAVDPAPPVASYSPPPPAAPAAPPPAAAPYTPPPAAPYTPPPVVPYAPPGADAAPRVPPPTDPDPSGAIHAIAGTEAVDAPYGVWPAGPPATPPAPQPDAGRGRHRVDTLAGQPGMPRWVSDVPRPANLGGPGTARGTASVPAGPPPPPAAAPPPAPEARQDPPPPRRKGRVTVGGVVRGTVRGFGELMITCGVVLLLFAGYEIYGKTAIVDAAQGDLDRAFDKAPVAASANRPSAGKPPPGDAVARLHIPRLAKKWVVVEGVAPDDIEVAPGHYPKSAMPGQTGNFSVAGHRVKSTFWDLDDMRPGDPIVVETKTNWYVYRTARSRIVKPAAVEVVDPVPPGFRSGDRLLTITTCNPKWDNYERLVVHASLVRSQARSAGDPAELRR